MEPAHMGWANRLIRKNSKPRYVPLTHPSPVFHFYTPWKCEKTFSFPTFSGDTDIDHWAKMALSLYQKSDKFPG